MKKSKWQGPQKTPGELGIDTPLTYLHESWNIAVQLLDKGRQEYRNSENYEEYPGAWLPVSLGKRGRLVVPWDERDIRHAAKMIAYLWADEEGLVEEYEHNLFIEHIQENGDFLTVGNQVSPYSNHIGMFSTAAADMP